MKQRGPFECSTFDGRHNWRARRCATCGIAQVELNRQRIRAAYRAELRAELRAEVERMLALGLTPDLLVILAEPKP